MITEDAMKSVNLAVPESFWAKGITGHLQRSLRNIGDKHGNLIIAVRPRSHILVEGKADNIAAAAADLKAIFVEVFLGAPIPFELAPPPPDACIAAVEQQRVNEKIFPTEPGSSTCGGERWRNEDFGNRLWVRSHGMQAPRIPHHLW